MIKELVVKNWKTSLFGVVSLVLFALTSFGVISPEQKEGLNEGVQEIVRATDGASVMDIITNIVAALSGILFLFVRDPKKVKE